MSDEKRLERIEDKLDTVVTKISSIDVTLAENKMILSDHTRRSLANEKAVEIIKNELKPVFIHVSLMNIVGKIALTILGSEVLWEIIKHFSS